MKKISSSFLCLSIVLVSSFLRADDCCSENGTSAPSPVRSLVLPRSQGSNTTRELLGWQDYIHLGDCEGTYTAVTAEFEYTRSFRAGRIARQLFGFTTPTAAQGCGDNDVFELRFQGSQANNRLSSSVLADNFGLSQDFDGTLLLSPRIDNFIVDFNAFVGLDCWWPGLYLRAHLPVTHTRWSLFGGKGARDCDGELIVEKTNSGSANTALPACYMAETATTAATSILAALSGNFVFGDMQTPWDFGKFSPTRLDKTRIADIDLILGYDFIYEPCHHFGAYVQFVAPTGNRPESTYIFEPIAGNGHHVGLGGGISAHRNLWNGNGDHNISVWFEGNAIHLFKDSQFRSFDFKTQGPGSRYMLLKEFDAAGAFTGNLINAINFATRQVRSSFAAEGDASIKFAYRNCGFNADIGYNIWGRSSEKIEVCQADTSLDNKYGFKGCQGVCFQRYPTAVDGTNTVIAIGPATAPEILNNTSSTSTITTCGDVDNAVQITPGTADPVALAWNSITTAGTILAPVAAEGVVFAEASVPPLLLTSTDLNLLGVRSALTNKIFGYVGYSWDDHCLTPFVGIHGEVEFAARRGKDCSTTTQNDCRKNCTESAINQWGIGIKGGLSF